MREINSANTSVRHSCLGQCAIRMQSCRGSGQEDLARQGPWRPEEGEGFGKNVGNK